MDAAPALLREAFDATAIDRIADGLVRSFDRRPDLPPFDAEAFRSRILSVLPELSFGDRNRTIIAALEEHLPDDFPRAASLLVDALGPEPAADGLSGFAGFYVMPMAGYIARRGPADPAHLEVSLHALYEMTKRFTAEGDIRPFLVRYPDRTLAFLRGLTVDPSPFARRLASEGTRPRLPLAARLPRFQADPAAVIALLDLLYDDPNEMVRRSVANNINDISKDNPEVAVATLARWRAEAPGPRTEALIRHGLRTLIKADHPGALGLLGFDADLFALADATISARSVRLGDPLDVSFTLRSAAPHPQPLALNYVIHFRKASGRTAPKVFRLRDKVLPGEGDLTVRKTHVFRDFRNQRFYSGPHRVEVVVNGRSVWTAGFDLVVPDHHGTE